VCFLAAALLFARVTQPRPWFDVVGKGLVALLAVQLVLGLLAYSSGGRPEEFLHVLYGAAALAVLPLARSFASEAPSRARAGTMAVAAAGMLALVWRAFSTA
jgi:hypothetical protein